MTQPASVVILAIVIFMVHAVQCYITYIEAKYPLKGTRSPPGSPWPLPQEWIRSNESIALNAVEFVISFTEHSAQCDIVKDAIRRTKRNIFHEPNMQIPRVSPMLGELKIRINDMSCGYPKFGDRENYTIEVPSDGDAAVLTAETVWSLIRGLETFTQLIWQDKDNHYVINKTSIRDWPEYKYRGLLLDTARHFVPMRTLLQNLDAMAYNKFNVFHWHIVDDQSFPMESRRYPNLTQLGAYSANHVYSQDDIRTIVETARLRGIRVIPEIDTPGHTQGLAKAFPELITTCYGEDGTPFTEIYAKHAKAEILDPTNEKVYRIFTELFEEVKTMFPDEYIHLGMDEVYYDCWMSNPTIQKFMKSKGFDKINQVEQYYVRRTLENVRNIGYRYMTWQDPVDNGVKLADDAIVQVWKDTKLVSSFTSWQEYVSPIVKQKYQVVLSSCWYLNYINYGEDWKTYYNCNPRGFEGTSEEKELVIGGEGCMWGEFVDGTNILARLWPRASAVAERLWSNPSLTVSTDDAQYRLDEQRCRMLRRGIPAQPILNGFCGDYDWDLLSSGANKPSNSLNFVLLTGFLAILYLPYSFLV